MTQTLSPKVCPIDTFLEMDILLLCSRTSLNPEQCDRLQTLIQQPLDWAALLQTADEHSLKPLLYSNLSKYCATFVPVDTLTQLQTHYDQNFQKNLYRTTELLKIVEDFETNGIAVLCFKGPTLTQMAYGNLALRQFLDLDLLVPELAVVQATHRLKSQGYIPQYDLSDQQVFNYARLRNEHSFWNEEKQICIDLHWAILPRYYSFSPDSEILWAERDRMTFASKTVETLSREHLLLFLCAHGAKHNWSCLFWICDLAELLRVSPNLDWQKIWQYEGQLGSPRMLRLGLYLAHRILSAPLPCTVLKALVADTSIPFQVQHIQSQLFHSPKKVSNFLKMDFLKRDFVYLKTFNSFKDIIWYWVDIILIPTPLEWQIITLPKILFFLYYPIRVIRLLLRYANKKTGN
jgi:Uncharacterised nucleotidyltransferase